MPAIPLDTWHLQACSIDGTTIPGVVGQAIEYNPQVVSPQSGGRLYESRHAVRRLMQAATLRTTALKTLVGTVFTGKVNELFRVFTSPGMVMRGALAAQDGAPGLLSAGGETRTAALGMCWLSALRGSLDDVAEATVLAAFRSSNGTTTPVADATAAVLAEPTAADEAYMLESVSLNGDEWESVQDVDIRCDLRVEPLYPASARYPTRLVSAGARGPVQWRVGLTVHDQLRLRESGFAEAVLTVVFRELSGAGGFGSGTVTGTFRGLLVPNQTTAGDQGAPLRGNVELLGRYDGTNKPAAWATA